jgi:hypothetical protein
MKIIELLKYTPVLSVILNILSVIAFLIINDNPRACYWALAAGLTVTTFYIKK